MTKDEGEEQMIEYEFEPDTKEEVMQVLCFTALLCTSGARRAIVHLDVYVLCTCWPTSAGRLNISIGNWTLLQTFALNIPVGVLRVFHHFEQYYDMKNNVTKYTALLLLQ